MDTATTITPATAIDPSRSPIECKLALGSECSIDALVARFRVAQPFHALIEIQCHACFSPLLPETNREIEIRPSAPGIDHCSLEVALHTLVTVFLLCAVLQAFTPRRRPTVVMAQGVGSEIPARKLGRATKSCICKSNTSQTCSLLRTNMHSETAHKGCRPNRVAHCIRGTTCAHDHCATPGATRKTTASVRLVG